MKNRFEVLQQSNDIEEQWKMFKDAVIITAEEKIGRRRGSKRENWIQDRTWTLIDKRKKLKSMKGQAKSVEEERQYNTEYRILNKAVKKSCRKDKNE